MADMRMTVDTAVIKETELTIRRQNERLTEILNDSKKTIDALKGEWTGEAADTTIGAYDQFAAKFFEEYQRMLNNYADFLKVAAGEGYESAEKKVSTLGKELEV